MFSHPCPPWWTYLTFLNDSFRPFHAMRWENPHVLRPNLFLVTPCIAQHYLWTILHVIHHKSKSSPSRASNRDENLHCILPIFAPTLFTSLRSDRRTRLDSANPHSSKNTFLELGKMTWKHCKLNLRPFLRTLHIRLRNLKKYKLANNHQ